MKISYLSIASFICFFILLWVDVHAQHGISHNQFGQLRNSFNSSLSTMDKQGSISLLNRNQWIGVDGAPKSIWASGNLGLQQLGASAGFEAKHVAMGILKETEISIYVAKSIKISENEYLGVAVGGGLLNFQGNYNNLDPTDPSFRDNIRQTDGILNASTSVYSPERYYVGASVPRFSLNRRSNKEFNFDNIYFITAGAVFRLNDMLHLRPSVLVGVADEQKSTFNASALFFMARKLGLGMGVQNQGNISGLLQLNFGSFGLGYSYQFGTNSNRLNPYISNSTHEIGLRYRVGGIGML
ncbi:hypothetical protein D3C86_650920 [compost metagenome]